MRSTLLNQELVRFAVCAVGCASVGLAQHAQHEGEDPNRLTDEYLPPQIEGFPERPAPLIEWGSGFMEPGELQDPMVLPTGAIWSPALTVWGTLRSGLAARQGGTVDQAEWANRLDLFAEGRFSATERVVVGMRPLDKNGVFSGYDLENGDWTDGANLDIQTLFFEGDFGEIFPGLDPEDSRGLDLGFGFGRQGVFFQDGVLINDVIDSLTVTRNSIRFAGMSNFRATALVAWNDIEHGALGEDEDASLVGVFTAADFDTNYLEVDFLASMSNNPSTGDGLYAGIGSTQRFGGMASTFRLNASLALDEGTTAVDDGVLLTSVLSWVPHHTHNNFYVASFLGVGDFRSAARAPGTGGPLGNIGILFAATGLGTVGAPINPFAADVLGGSVGYQQLFNGGRSQMVYEFGVRAATDGDDDNTAAVGARYRRAMGQRMILTIDAFAGNDAINDGFFGGRFELLWRF